MPCLARGDRLPPLHDIGDHVRRAFTPLAILTVLLGAGCDQAPVPKPTPYAGAPLPVPPAPPRVPPRPRTTAADATQVDPGPAGEQDQASAPAGVGVEELPGTAPVAVETPQAHAALPPGLVVPPPSTPAPTLASLAGLNEGEVLQRFGRPSRAAAVGQGMRWTWDVEGCEMTMTLFPDVAAQMRRVLSAELRGAARDELGEAGCLDRLGRRRAGL